MNETTNFNDIFRQEADELLFEIEEAVLEIEENPDDKEAINRIFRAVHTIKGSGGMLGFTRVAQFTHTLETVLDTLREGRLTVDKNLINLILRSRDHIKSILDSTSGVGEIDPDQEKILLTQLNDLIPLDDDKNAQYESGNGQEETLSKYSPKESIYRITFKPGKDIFRTGTDPGLLIEELKSFGDHNIILHYKNIPSIDVLIPDECYLSWDIILTTSQTADDIKDVFIFVEDNCELTIDIVDELIEGDDYKEVKKIGEILVERQVISEEDIKSTLNDQKRLGELLIEKNKVDYDTIETALAEQTQIKKTREKHREEIKASSLRVTSEKLDSLVDLVGELVTVQARLSQFSSVMDHSELLSIAEEVEKLTTELRDNTMDIRMMPIGTIFSKFKRLVRDLSSDLGKSINLLTEGAETELDKTVIDRLDDPLVHLIRNCIDHGIETPSVRKENGKQETGTIKLSAVHKGAYVVITIKDDGAGLNADAIKEKAIEKGIIQREAVLSEKQIYELIFTPGFSTATTVTNISGRGVGMDVVKRTIVSLRGSIELDSSPGQGTMITLKLPLTLAIINGLLVSIADTCYILPLATVEECVELTQENSDQSHGSNLLNVRGEIVPYIRLRDHLNIEGKRPNLEHIVITDVQDKRIGFVVDKVIGGHQTVIKALGPAFKYVREVSGATILGDGKIALILDVNALMLFKEH
ncbi:MAG: chemotaxis protein CheA [Deltaproteobacteria bacterium]|nr:chemotaxis protein CheA [Deltaproteobacteria bacterium]